MTDLSKRGFIHAASSLTIAGGLVAIPAAGLVHAAAAAEHKRQRKNEKNEKKEDAVTPPEDLMREHGVLDRVLLIYEAVIKNFDANRDFDPAVLTQSAEVVRDFIENYHEKSEEEQVFPRFRRAGKMVDLIETLLV